MALAINVGYGLYHSFSRHQHRPGLKFKSTFKRVFWTDSLTVSFSSVSRHTVLKLQQLAREKLHAKTTSISALCPIVHSIGGAKFKSARVLISRQPCCISQRSFNKVSENRYVKIKWYFSFFKLSLTEGASKRELFGTFTQDESRKKVQ